MGVAVRNTANPSKHTSGLHSKRPLRPHPLAPKLAHRPSVGENAVRKTARRWLPRERTRMRGMSMCISHRSYGKIPIRSKIPIRAKNLRAQWRARARPRYRPQLTRSTVRSCLPANYRVCRKQERTGKKQAHVRRAPLRRVSRPAADQESRPELRP